MCHESNGLSRPVICMSGTCTKVLQVAALSSGRDASRSRSVEGTRCARCRSDPQKCVRPGKFCHGHGLRRGRGVSCRRTHANRAFSNTVRPPSIKKTGTMREYIALHRTLPSPPRTHG